MPLFKASGVEYFVDLTPVYMTCFVLSTAMSHSGPEKIKLICRSAALEMGPPFSHLAKLRKIFSEWILHG